jgi:hypothetical protein
MQQIDPSLIDDENEDDEGEFQPLSTLLEHGARPAKRLQGFVAQVISS